MMLQYRLGLSNDLNPQDQSISNDDEFRLKTGFFHVHVLYDISCDAVFYHTEN
jgi:hypothetical protein